MQNKTKTLIICIMVFSMLAFASLVPPAKAAGAITLTPNQSVTAGGSVSISGTGFGTTVAVGIGFGSEVAKNDQGMLYTGTGMGPYSGTVSAHPVKVGSFTLYSDTTAGGGIVSTYSDNGDGTTAWSYDGTTMGTINYVTGAWSRSSSVDVTGIATNYTATYTTYQYAVTPGAGITTNSTGGFTASITVPSVANGVYTVTAIDAQGHLATASIGVGVTIPETLTVSAIVLLSSVAVIAGAVLLRKPKVKGLSSTTL